MPNLRHAWVAQIVFDLLVEECGAKENHREDFVYSLSHRGTSDYRFQGNLGFGGKLYNEARGFRVTCYRENETPDRVASIGAVNGVLKQFWEAIVRESRRPCPHCLGVWTGALIDCETCPRCFADISKEFIPEVFR